VNERLLLVDDEWIATGDWCDVRSPYSGEVVGRVPWAGRDLVLRSIEAAERAMTEPIPAFRRAEILVRIAELLEERTEDLARAICAESGKPILQARGEVSRAVSTYRLSAGEAERLAGEVVPMEGTAAGAGHVAFTVRVPVGVVAAITPFNFPLNLVAHKIAPALAAGCAVVLKPADKTPLTALMLAEIEREAGLPAGWLNVVVAPPEEFADIVVSDDRVGLVTFTGSAAIGWKLREKAPTKRVTLELGNATPAIVEADADIGVAAAKLAATAYAFSGQSCISVQRVLVHRDVYDDFLAAFVPKVTALTCGDPADESTDIGPLITQEATERVRELIAGAQAAGATVVAGGGLDGAVVEPTVLADVSPEMDVFCREAFAPLVTVSPYDTLDEAFDLANGTPYGLQAAIFTSNITTALQAARRLDFGGVMVNQTPTFRADQMPYGGRKLSGNTKEGPAATVRVMTDERLVVIGE
jgi:acyl-CoA reductase-like NAD-dependent aldehyde dehydrogenase